MHFSEDITIANPAMEIDGCSSFFNCLNLRSLEWQHPPFFYFRRPANKPFWGTWTLQDVGARIISNVLCQGVGKYIDARYPPPIIYGRFTYVFNDAGNEWPFAFFQFRNVIRSNDNVGPQLPMRGFFGIVNRFLSGSSQIMGLLNQGFELTNLFRGARAFLVYVFT